MKKSTVVALLVALAAVAGILAALYFYVLRRERELDEYEQLLFSEDFDDDLMDDDLEAPAEPTDA
ncbi:MAG: phosphatase [Ruminococcaceae bacterium]|nr:phosphatase [Oscillospiraceae bacterium]